MQIHLRFFASLREAVGVSQESVSLPVHVQNAGQVREYLRERDSIWFEALSEERALRMACNQQMAEPETLISEGCELAFFPPVTGG